MRTQDIAPGTQWIEKKPDTHTDKLQKVTVLKIRQHYESGNKHPYKPRNYTYIYYKTNEGQYYPAKNRTERNLFVLDGLVGCHKLTEFKKLFTPINLEP
jgi:hypothetical protein